MREKPNCEKHKDHVEKYDGTIKELAEDIGDLRYDTLVEFLGHLSSKLKNDGIKDFNGGRENLADSLRIASVRIDFANQSVKEAWRISKPFMYV
jgi:NADH dehydrogenase FAD-containing subunit